MKIVSLLFRSKGPAFLTSPQAPSPKIGCTQVRLTSRHLSAFSSESVKEAPLEPAIASCVWQILSKACEAICVMTRHLQMENHGTYVANKQFVAVIHYYFAL